MMQQATVIDKPAFTGPDPAAMGQVLSLIYGRFAGQAVCLAAKLGVADAIAAGATSTERLARHLGATPASLGRFLAALASSGIVAEEFAGEWRLTPAGELLRGDVAGSVRDLARLFATPEHAKSWLELER